MSSQKKETPNYSHTEFNTALLKISQHREDVDTPGFHTDQNASDRLSFPKNMEESGNSKQAAASSSKHAGRDSFENLAPTTSIMMSRPSNQKSQSQAKSAASKQPGGNDHNSETIDLRGSNESLKKSSSSQKEAGNQPMVASFGKGPLNMFQAASGASNMPQKLNDIPENRPAKSNIVYDADELDDEDYN